MPRAYSAIREGHRRIIAALQFQMDQRAIRGLTQQIEPERTGIGQLNIEPLLDWRTRDMADRNLCRFPQQQLECPIVIRHHPVYRRERAGTLEHSSLNYRTNFVAFLRAWRSRRERDRPVEKVAERNAALFPHLCEHADRHALGDRCEIRGAV